MGFSGIGYLTSQRNMSSRIIRHVLFWTFHILYNVATWGVYNDHVLQSLVTESLTITGKVLMCYYTLYYLIPTFLLPRKYLLFIIWFSVGLVLCGLLNRAISYFIIYPIYYPDAVGSGYFRIKIFFEMTAIVNVTALAAAIKLLQFWNDNEQSRRDLSQEKIEAELKLLKSQIHPHFLFNTLNNLYALALEKSDKAPDIVIKLSSLLNYMLYECNVERVPLEKELAYIRDYVSLEKIRYGEILDLSFEISGSTDDYQIAPLVLIPFVENSFKHGASQESFKPYVHLNIWIRDGKFTLKLENSVAKERSSDRADYTSGIGLRNVKRRLDIIYKDRYELTITEDESYLVVLSLELDKK